MKKIIITIILFLSLLNISSSSFAASCSNRRGSQYLIVEGSIVSLNPEENRFAIKDKDDGKVYTFSAFVSQLAPFNQGDNVKVMVPIPGQWVSKILKR